MSHSLEINSGIVLAIFGTSVEKGLPGLLHIRDRMVSRFQDIPVKIAFTSKIIRQIWRERASRSDYAELHPETDEDILAIRSPAQEIQGLLDDGVGSLVLQPVQIAPAREIDNPGPYMGGMEKQDQDELLSAFTRIAVGRPALGTLGSRYSYNDDIVPVANALAQDFELARKKQSALFYLGHGNKLSETGRVYNELMTEIRRQYPDVPTVMSMVEGSPDISELIKGLQQHGVQKVLLKAFMLVAGNHARKEMAGDGPDTLKTILQQQGFKVEAEMTGLGECPAFADIFVQHASDAARDAGIQLMK